MFLNKLRGRKAQGTLEYAILISLVVAALLAMNAYMKGGIQGRIKTATDDIGQQYSPKDTVGLVTTNSEQTNVEKVANEVATKLTTNEITASQNRESTETTSAPTP